MFFANRILCSSEAATTALRPPPLHCQALSLHLPAAVRQKIHSANPNARDRREQRHCRRHRHLGPLGCANDSSTTCSGPENESEGAVSASIVPSPASPSLAGSES